MGSNLFDVERRNIMRWSMLAVALSVSLAACGTDSTGDDEVDCTKVTGTDTFVVGLDKAGMSGTLDFKLMSADPAPPSRDDNAWIVQVSTMNAGVVGSPVD